MTGGILKAMLPSCAEVEETVYLGKLGGENKPRLFVDTANPDRTVAALRDILAGAGELYVRGVPVRIAFHRVQLGSVAHRLRPLDLVLFAHGKCRPFALKRGEEVDTGLPTSMATMYLGWRGEYRLQPLNGIVSVPLLRNDGTIFSSSGYDAASGMYLENVPVLNGLVPECPQKADAAAALLLLRDTFRTFCFADAETIYDSELDIFLVDTTKAPGRDESGFLNALLTAVCRPSLHLAPGILFRAPPMSGAGAGKGLLARCIAILAFGREPHAVTAGANSEELEKRIVAELIGASPTLFLDNLNNTAFRFRPTRQRHH